jgi:hypothetical protein
MFLQLALQKQNKSFSINDHRIVTDPELKLKTLNIDHMPSQSKDKTKIPLPGCPKLERILKVLTYQLWHERKRKIQCKIMLHLAARKSEEKKKKRTIIHPKRKKKRSIKRTVNEKMFR